MRILVVEDEVNIGQFVWQGLEKASYAVDLVQEGRLGLEYALTLEY
ncbi:hypothetical protein ACFLU3_03115 [Chloroflexota bacterium]